MRLLVSILTSDILPIFAIAGAGFLLARYAREHGYEITRFVQPVRLRDRVRDVRHRITSVSVPVPPRPAITVSAVAAGVGAGAFVLGWWLGARRHHGVGLGAP